MEKLLVTSNFSFSHSVFYPFEEHSAIFIKFKIFSIWKSLKFVVWERVTTSRKSIDPHQLKQLAQAE